MSEQQERQEQLQQDLEVSIHMEEQEEAARSLREEDLRLQASTRIAMLKGRLLAFKTQADRPTITLDELVNNTTPQKPLEGDREPGQSQGPQSSTPQQHTEGNLSPTFNTPSRPRRTFALQDARAPSHVPRASPGSSWTSGTSTTHKLDTPFYGFIQGDMALLKHSELDKAYENIRADAKAAKVSVNPYERSSGAAITNLANIVRERRLPTELVLGAIVDITERPAREDVETLHRAVTANGGDTATKLDLMAHGLADMTKARRFDALSTTREAVTVAYRFSPAERDLRAHAVRIEQALADLLHLTGRTLSETDVERDIAASIVSGLPPAIPITLMLRQEATTAHALGHALTAEYVLGWLRTNEEVYRHQASYFDAAERMMAQPLPFQSRQPQTQHQEQNRSRPQNNNNRGGTSTPRTANVRTTVAGSDDSEREAIGEGAMVLHTAASACRCEPANRHHEPGPDCAAPCMHPECTRRGVNQHNNDKCYRQNPAARPDFQGRRA